MSKLCLGCMEQYGDQFNVCPNCGYIEGTKQEEAVHMEPGTMLYGRYIVGKVLGFGGFGVTYIGFDTKLEQKVAIKEYLPSEFSTRMPGEATVTVFGGEKNEQFLDGLDKFVEEAKRLANFQNEVGIVKVFDSFKENNTAYIIMEYLDGETLTSYMEREGTIPEEQAIKMLEPVMVSLQSVHEKGILHRDIAPDNIFIQKNGEVKLIDFGASRYATTSHSRSLTVIIKPGYSPEEQYRSRGDQGPHTDVYALSAVMYKMITGITPPDALERRALIETKRKDMLKDLHKTVKNISVNTENAVLNAMNVQIEDRTPDIATFMAELNSATPVKRRYGKIKKIDLYSWPLWLKIALPTCLVALLTVAILLLSGVIKFKSTFSDDVVVPDGFVVVPDVEGMDKDKALKLIEENNLTPTPEGNVVSEYIDAGKIVLQTPTGGSYLHEYEKVILTVSSGQGVVGPTGGISTVPYVIWDTQETAIEKLNEAGLAEPVIETVSDDNVPAGQVISQSEQAGTQLPEGSQITIVVSTGPAAFDMPNVVGKTQSAAQDTLTKNGLIVSVTYAKDDSVESGKVISQSVKSGTKVKSGDKITITVSSGKAIVAVPNVVGMTQSNAETALKDKGFKMVVAENYDANVEKGKVISQSPAGGTNQIKGSTINIIVSKGKQPVTVTLNANGGTVSEGSRTVYLSSTYGTLPTPKRDYYTFTGWYTAQSGGTKIESSTKVTSTANHTLYARWSENDWVEVNSLPSNISMSNATIQKNVREKLTKTSTSSSLSGWTYDGIYKDYNWVDKGWISSKPAESETLRITDDKTVTDKAAYTEYRYFRYRKSGDTKMHWCTKLAINYHGGTWYEQWTEWSTTRKKLLESNYGRCSCHGYVNKYGTENSPYYYEYSRVIPAVTHTEWRYETTTPREYKFYKWSDWYGWTSDTGGSWDNDIEVKYRYKLK